MPFAYFFTESEGFAGSRKVSGVIPRQETEFHSDGSTEEILTKTIGRGLVRVKGTHKEFEVLLAAGSHYHL